MIAAVKSGFYAHVGRYFDGLIENTRGIVSLKNRGRAGGVVVVNGPLVESVQAVMDAWQARTDPNSLTTKPHELPCIFIGFSSGFTPTGRDWGRQISDSVDIQLPGDEKGRWFKAKLSMIDLTAQIIFAAADSETAISLAAQFSLFIELFGNDAFACLFDFAGGKFGIDSRIENTASAFAPRTDTGVSHENVLVCELTIKAFIPIFNHHLGDDPSDGKGGGVAGDPNGYPIVEEWTTEGRGFNV